MTDNNDQKYLDWIAKQLIAYVRAEVPLGVLIGNLESLVGQMEHLGVEERNQFLEYCGDLEQAYAFSLERGSEPLDANAKQIVDDSIANLNRWVDRAKAKGK